MSSIDYSAVRPTLDHVVVKRKKADSKIGSIIIPDNAREKPAEGIVVRVGPGWVYDNGRRQEPHVKIGDRVLFGKYSGTQLQNTDEFMIIRESDILAVLEPDDA